MLPLTSHTGHEGSATSTRCNLRFWTPFFVRAPVTESDSKAPVTLRDSKTPLIRAGSGFASHSSTEQL